MNLGRSGRGGVAQSLLSQVVHSFLWLGSFSSVRGKLVLDALKVLLRLGLTSALVNAATRTGSLRGFVFVEFGVAQHSLRHWQNP